MAGALRNGIPRCPYGDGAGGRRSRWDAAHCAPQDGKSAPNKPWGSCSNGEAGGGPLAAMGREPASPTAAHGLASPNLIACQPHLSTWHSCSHCSQELVDRRGQAARLVITPGQSPADVLHPSMVPHLLPLGCCLENQLPRCCLVSAAYWDPNSNFTTAADVSSKKP